MSEENEYKMIISGKKANKPVFKLLNMHLSKYNHGEQLNIFSPERIVISESNSISVMSKLEQEHHNFQLKNKYGVKSNLNKSNVFQSNQMSNHFDLNNSIKDKKTKEKMEKLPKNEKYAKNSTILFNKTEKNVKEAVDLDENIKSKGNTETKHVDRFWDSNFKNLTQPQEAKSFLSITRQIDINLATIKPSNAGKHSNMKENITFIDTHMNFEKSEINAVIKEKISSDQFIKNFSNEELSFDNESSKDNSSLICNSTWLSYYVISMLNAVSENAEITDDKPLFKALNIDSSNQKYLNKSKKLENLTKESIKIIKTINLEDQKKIDALHIARCKIYHVELGNKVESIDWKEPTSITKAKIFGLRYPAVDKSNSLNVDKNKSISSINLNRKIPIIITATENFNFRLERKHEISKKTYNTNYGDLKLDIDSILYHNMDEMSMFYENNKVLLNDCFVFNFVKKDVAINFLRDINKNSKVFYILFTLKDLWESFEYCKVKYQLDLRFEYYIFVIPLGKRSNYDNYLLSMKNFVDNLIKTKDFTIYLEENINEKKYVFYDIHKVSLTCESDFEKFFDMELKKDQENNSEMIYSLNGLQCDEKNKNNHIKYLNLIKTHKYQSTFEFKRKNYVNLPRAIDNFNHKYKIDYTNAIKYEDLREVERKEFSIFCHRNLRYIDDQSKMKKLWRKLTEYFKKSTEDEIKYYQPLLINEDIYKIGDSIIKRCKESPSTFRKPGKKGFFYFLPIFLQEFRYGYTGKYEDYKKKKTYDWIYADRRISLMNDWMDLKKWLKKTLYVYLMKNDHQFLLSLNDYQKIIENNKKELRNLPILYNFFKEFSTLNTLDVNQVSGDTETLTELEFQGLLITGMRSDVFVDCLLNSNVDILDLGDIYIGYFNNILKGIFPFYVAKTNYVLGKNKGNLKSAEIDYFYNKYLFFSLPENERKLFMFTLAVWRAMEKNIDFTRMTVTGCIVCFCPSLVNVYSTPDARTALFGAIQMLERLVAYLNIEFIDLKTYNQFIKYLKSKKGF